MSVNWVSVGLGNGLSPVWRQAITWTNAGLLSIGPLGTNFSGIQIKIQNFSLIKMYFEMLSAKLAATLSRGDELNKFSSCYSCFTVSYNFVMISFRVLGFCSKPSLYHGPKFAEFVLYAIFLRVIFIKVAHGTYCYIWKLLTETVPIFMMMSTNGNIFRITGPLCGEFTSHHSIRLTKASDVKLWCLLWFAPE